MFADHLGSARVVTNSSGTILDDSDFYAYGGERVVSSASGNVYKFEGKERDAESGLDDFGARYYSSQYGRFVSADWSAIPVAVPYANLTNPQTLNLYAIVHDSPETFADLDGHLEVDDYQVNTDGEDSNKINQRKTERVTVDEAQKQNTQQTQNQQPQQSPTMKAIAEANRPPTDAEKMQAVSDGAKMADAGVKAGLVVEGLGVAAVIAAPVVVPAVGTAVGTVGQAGLTASQTVGAATETYIPGGVATLSQARAFVGGLTGSNPQGSTPSVGGMVGSMIRNEYLNLIKPYVQETW